MRASSILLFIGLAAMAWAKPQDSGARGISSRPERLPEEILEKHEDYNLVRYKATKWVCTTMTAEISGNEESGDNLMFMKLFNYISGQNSEKVKIDMSSPVTTLRRPVSGKPNMEEIEMCFWTGTPWQDKELPTPLDKDVHIQERPSIEVFVRRFGGWVFSRSEWMEHKQALENSLAGRTDVDESPEAGFYTVGYDSPWKPINRRNEVWIYRKSSENTKARISKETLESPPFTVVSSNEKFELREYPATKWVCTKMADIDPTADPMNGWEDEFNNNPFAAMASENWESATSGKMFSKLFAYIAGLNSDSAEIPMTSPVTHLHDPNSSPTSENQEMCFWLGSAWQDSPPQPSSKNVYIQERPTTRVYVRKFGGFALSYDDYHKHYLALKQDLEKMSVATVDDKEGRFFQISYDSPFVVKDRRNEVWVMEKATV